MGVEKVFEIADTTMRDGAQMHGIQFALREKLERDPDPEVRKLAVSLFRAVTIRCFL